MFNFFRNLVANIKSYKNKTIYDNINDNVLQNVNSVAGHGGLIGGTSLVAGKTV